MKTFVPTGLATTFCRTVALLIFICSPWALRAQLVADGQTAILDGVGTNIAGNVTVGTNGTFTLLIVTNGAAVTNSGTVLIGSSINAANNRLAVGGAGSVWYNTGSAFYIGSVGSSNELDILDGGVVTNSTNYLGASAASSNNTVRVSGAGSLWQTGVINFEQQPGGQNNQLVVTNGGSVVSSSGSLGFAAGRNNSAIVTGANSIWTNTAGLAIGAIGSNSWLLVTNGGTVASSAFSGLGMLSTASSSNLAVVTDSGSSWKAGVFYVGQYSSGNQLKILNGGKMATLTSYLGYNGGLTNNLALVDGTGSLWTNSDLFYVGFNGVRNTLIVTNGGRVSFGNCYVTSSNNTVVATGAGTVWKSGAFNLGYQGPGRNQLRIDQGATFTVSGGLLVGGAGCHSNLLTVTDSGSSLQCNGFSLLGNLGTNNQCVVSNGATLVTLFNTPTQITGTSTRMTATGAGSLCSFAGDLRFGQDSNVLAILDGATLVNNNGYIQSGLGAPDGKPNTVVVAGAGSYWHNLADLHMMVENNAQLLITNGGVVADSNAYIDDSSSSTYTISPGLNCYVLVSGAGSLWTNSADVYIGNVGAANQVLVSDSGTVTATNFYLGNLLDGNQLVVSNSGTVLIGNELQIGGPNSKSNSVVISDGAIGVTNTVSLNDYASVTLNSGVLRAGYLTLFATTNQFNFNGGLLQLGGSHCFDSSPLVVGDGTDAATFEMLLNGTHILPGGLVIAGNGLLKGFGTITGNITVNSGGTIAPGEATTGTIAVQGNVALNAGSKTLMKVNPITSAADSLSDITNLTYGGILELESLADHFAAGNSFQLFTATNYSGAFDGLVPATPGAGLRWDTNELNIDGVLRVVSTTPPAPALAAGLVAGGNLLVSATGGVPYDPCYLLTCTNFPPVPADWTYVATNYFDGAGAVSFTNAIPAGEPQRYFKVQVN